MYHLSYKCQNLYKTIFTNSGNQSLAFSETTALVAMIMYMMNIMTITLNIKLGASTVYSQILQIYITVRNTYKLFFTNVTVIVLRWKLSPGGLICKNGFIYKQH